MFLAPQGLLGSLGSVGFLVLGLAGFLAGFSAGVGWVWLAFRLAFRLAFGWVWLAFWLAFGWVWLAWTIFPCFLARLAGHFASISRGRFVAATRLRAAF